MDHLDGNVLAGPTAGLFVFEPTTTPGQCRACDDVAMLGQAMVYGQPMGFVARCRNCDSVLIVIVELAGQKSFNMRGLRWLRVRDQTIDGHIQGQQ
jgi:hypothetical protein